MREFAIIGLGRFGTSVARSLGDKGHQILAIDNKSAPVQDAAEYATHAVQVDATDEKALRAVGIEEVEVAVVGIGEDVEASILITLILREIGIKTIVARAVSENHGKVLKRVGATMVVFPERDMGIRVAEGLVSPNVIEHIDLSDEYSIVEIMPPKEFVGHSIRELDIHAKYGIIVIAIKERPVIVRGEKRHENINISPKADDIIHEGDELVVVGSNEAIERLKGK